MVSNAPPYLDLDNESILLALCIWREARSEPVEAKLGVKWVIKNRCSLAPREGFKPTINGNIYKKYAFSSFNQNDPNYLKFPKQDDPAWLECLQVVGSDDPDPTGSAVFYFSPPLNAPPKAWGNVVPTVKLGVLHFYKLAEYAPIPG